jgi:uncharacterized membrane protein YoaK (UPF0700 family)
VSLLHKPWALNGVDGPLPALLLVMTFVTGLVDAFAYLVLGHVFVANMTGNVVFLGFALAGAHSFSLLASLAAIAAFMIGAAIGGELSSRLSHHRGRLLSVATMIQSVFMAIALVLAIAINGSVSPGLRYALICSLGVAMGLQNAVARKLAVADLTTTVLTMTLTGIAADHTAFGGAGWKVGRRASSVVCMFAGGLVGAMLVLHVSDVVPLAIALVAILFVALATGVLGRHGGGWTKSKD